MEAKFADLFESWISEKHVYLVSGSDLSKIKEQIPNNILKKCKGIFSCMGNEFWVDNKKIYENELDVPEEIESFLESKIINSDFENIIANQITSADNGIIASVSSSVGNNNLWRF